MLYLEVVAFLIHQLSGAAPELLPREGGHKHFENKNTLHINSFFPKLVSLIIASSCHADVCKCSFFSSILF